MRLKRTIEADYQRASVRLNSSCLPHKEPSSTIMFEITPQDIAQLDDEKLRTLVGLLCEAELRGRGYSTAAVTWGGNQNAKDGGLDVRGRNGPRD
jgi:hypothetical protein